MTTKKNGLFLKEKDLLSFSCPLHRFFSFPKLLDRENVIIFKPSSDRFRQSGSKVEMAGYN